MSKLSFRRILFLLVILAGICAAIYLFPSSKRERPRMGASPVSVAESIRQDVPHYLQGIGTVRPYADVLVTSRVSGELIKIHFTEGQRVNAGDLLAEIDPRPFKAELAKAKGTLAKDQAELANARTDQKRYAKLASQDFVSRQTADQYTAKVRQLEGSVAADKAEVQAAELNLIYSRIIAPISGRLGLKNVDVGTMITANDTKGIVRITQTRPCYVTFPLPESNVDLITQALRRRELAEKEGKELPRPLVEAWSREQKELLSLGELLSVDNTIDSESGTVKLKAIFSNENIRLFPNEFVNARLRVRVLENVVTIPPAAVQLGANGSFVFVVDKENTVHLRPVETSISTGTISVIQTGLEAGEKVVIDGVDRLRNGAKVRIASIIQTVHLNEKTNTPLATESDKTTPVKEQEPPHRMKKERYATEH